LWEKFYPGFQYPLLQGFLFFLFSSKGKERAAMAAEGGNMEFLLRHFKSELTFVEVNDIYHAHLREKVDSTIHGGNSD
jgi:hypothetical protein